MKYLSVIVVLLLALLIPSRTDVGSFVALKGFSGNNPPSINTLSPDWFYTDFGTWLMNRNSSGNLIYDFGSAKMVLSLTNYTTIPSQSDLLLLTTHPQYKHWWMLGANEADINGYTAQQAANVIIAQGNAVLAVDSLARFSVMGLSQVHPMSGQYFWKVWNKLPSNIKARVFGVNAHFYTQSAGLPDSSTFLAQPIEDYLDLTQGAMTAHGIGELEIWLTEIGIAKTPYTLVHLSDVANYPNVIQSASDGRATRYAIYAEWSWAVAANYFDLQNSDESITDMGQTFIAQ